MAFIERYYQTEMLDAAEASFDKGVRKMVLASATGTGKSYVFSKLYERFKKRLPKRMLIIAHSEELVRQNAATAKEVNPDAKVGIEQGETQSDPDCDIISGCIYSLNRGKRLERMINVDKIVVDEAHHAVADSYQTFLSEVWTPEKLLVGMTATPTRGDGRPLGEVFESIPYVYSLRQAIADGYLVEPCGFTLRTKIDLSEVKKGSSGDYQKDALAAAINTAERNQQIVQFWRHYAADKRTVVFCATIEHARKMCDAFQLAGVQTAYIWGDDPDRELKISMHQKGEIDVLCNVGILVEGYNDPNIGCVVLARPTVSPVLFAQMVGRVTRLAPGKFVGLVLDVVDSVGKNTLLTLPTLFGMPWSIQLNGHSAYAAVKRIEELQETHPGIDFTKLDDFTQLDAFVEKAKLFEVRFPKEIEENSSLMWHKSIEGGYRINVPKPDKDTKGGYVRVFQNALDKWEINGIIGGARFHGFRAGMEDAIKTADEQITRRAGSVMKLLNRKATWHKEKPSIGQELLWKKIMGGRPFPEGATKGEVSKLIDARLSILKERK
jgi:superfamily II DNA or RNA helicase